GPRSRPEPRQLDGRPLRSLPRSAASQPWAIVAGYGGNQAVWSRRAGKAVLAVGIPSLASRAKDAGVEGGGFLSGRGAATEPAHPPPARRFPWRHRPSAEARRTADPGLAGDRQGARRGMARAAPGALRSGAEGAGAGGRAMGRAGFPAGSAPN